MHGDMNFLNMPKKGFVERGDLRRGTKNAKFRVFFSFTVSILTQFDRGRCFGLLKYRSNISGDEFLKTKNQRRTLLRKMGIQDFSKIS